jgi:hypothetical protein
MCLTAGSPGLVRVALAWTPGRWSRFGRHREEAAMGRNAVVVRPVHPGRFRHVVLVPRRARCRGCGATHVLLPAWCLARRADAGEVIGLALEAKAAGAGHRAIARRLGRPASTVRGWLRALSRRAGQVRLVFTALAASLVTDPPLPAPAGSAVADAVAAVAAAAVAAATVEHPGFG